jgi:hypothetical protein
LLHGQIKLRKLKKVKDLHYKGVEPIPPDLASLPIYLIKVFFRVSMTLGKGATANPDITDHLPIAKPLENTNYGTNMEKPSYRPPFLYGAPCLAHQKKNRDPRVKVPA